MISQIERRQPLKLTSAGYFNYYRGNLPTEREGINLSWKPIIAMYLKHTWISFIRKFSSVFKVI